MLQKISKCLTLYLYKRGEINDSKLELIQYGFEITLSSLAMLISILIYSTILFHIFDGLIFILFFIPIRLFCGGYHADTYLKCYVYTMLFFFGVILSSYLLPIRNFGLNAILLIIATTYIYMKSPHINENHPLTNKKVIKNRKRARVVAIVNLLLAALLVYLNLKSGTIAAYTIILVALLLFVSENNVKTIKEERNEYVK